MSTPSSEPSAEPTTDQSVFEGLFVRVLKPQGQFLEDLKAVGYDPANPQRKYHSRIWRDAVLVACRHVHPGVPQEQAVNLLGRRFIEGFFETIVGKVIAVMVPYLSPEMLVNRIPKFASMAASGITVTVKPEPPDRWRLCYTDAYPLPDFTAGLMQGALDKTRMKSIEVVSRSETGYELLFDARK